MSVLDRFRPVVADEAVGAAILFASDASSYATESTVFCAGERVGTIA